MTTSRLIRWSQVLAVATVAIAVVAPAAAADEGYRLPPPEVVAMLDAPPTPGVSVSPDGATMVLVHRETLPPISEMARPMERLAGLRLDAATNGRHGPRSSVGLTIKDMATGVERDVRIPDDVGVSFPSWAPNGERFAFSVTRRDGIELWVCELASGRARMVADDMNLAAGGFSWMNDSATVVARIIPGDRGAMPQRSPVPAGPVMQESDGRTSPVRTYQDLLSDRHDEAMFDWLMGSQIVMVDATGGGVKAIGAAAVYTTVSPSPDGDYLLVGRLEKPYSYLVTSWSFPTTYEVWRRDGTVVATIDEKPLRDTVPIGGVETGRRSIAWQANAPSSLVWVEALDGGDPKTEATERDRVMMQAAPFASEPAEVVRLEDRSRGISWVDQGQLGMVSEYDRDTRWTRTWLVDFAAPGSTPRLVFERNTQDRFADPGRPMTTRNAFGRSVARVHDGHVFLSVADPGEVITPTEWVNRLDALYNGAAGIELVAGALSVSELAQPGTAVGVVTPLGEDGAGLTFDITAGNTGGAFAIDDSGVITVAGPLDRATTPAYSLTVEATDGERTGSLVVGIGVKALAGTDLTLFDHDFAAPEFSAGDIRDQGGWTAQNGWSVVDPAGQGEVVSSTTAYQGVTNVAQADADVGDVLRLEVDVRIELGAGGASDLLRIGVTTRDGSDSFVPSLQNNGSSVVTGKVRYNGSASNVLTVWPDATTVASQIELVASEIGVDFGAGDRTTDTLRFAWEAEKSATTGLWDVRLVVTNLDTNAELGSNTIPVSESTVYSTTSGLYAGIRGLQNSSASTFRIDRFAYQLGTPGAPLPGDYNGDGSVDASDYTAWRDQLGQQGPSLTADSDGSGTVDQVDYNTWRSNFGLTLPPAAEAAVAMGPVSAASADEPLAGLVVGASGERDDDGPAIAPTPVVGATNDSALLLLFVESTEDVETAEAETERNDQRSESGSTSSFGDNLGAGKLIADR